MFMFKNINNVATVVSIEGPFHGLFQGSLHISQDSLITSQLAVIANLRIMMEYINSRRVRLILASIN